jgi:hypothetical protein
MMMCIPHHEQKPDPVQYHFMVETRSSLQYHFILEETLS